MDGFEPLGDFGELLGESGGEGLQGSDSLGRESVSFEEIFLEDLWREGKGKKEREKEREKEKRKKKKEKRRKKRKKKKRKTSVKWEEVN